MNASMELQAVPFHEIPHTTELFAAFLGDFPRVAKFYSHPPDFSGIAAAAREVRLDPGIRRAVAEILREQNRRFAPGNQLDPAAGRNLDRLGEAAVAVVTGQQAGLFSGPAFSFYKALSAVRCAEELTRRGEEFVQVPGQRPGHDPILSDRAGSCPLSFSRPGRPAGGTGRP